MSLQVMHRPPVAGSRRPRRRPAPTSDPVIAVDVGSSSVRIATSGDAAIEEPSVVAMVNDRVVAAGWSALQAAEEGTRELSIVHPVCGGAPVRRGLYTELVRQVSARASVPESPGTMAVSMPAWIGSDDWGEVLACIRAALPTDEVVVVLAPVAAALGARLVPPDGQPQVVLDVGHHLAEAAVVADGVAIAAESTWTGGADARATLAGHLLGSRGLDAGPRSLERALRLASHPRYGNVAVRGVDTGTGQGRVVLLHSDEVASVLTPVFDQVADVALRALEATPSRFAAAARGQGVLLTGGMARVHGLRERVADAVGAAVGVVDAPTRSVVDGLRRIAAGDHAQR